MSTNPVGEARAWLAARTESGVGLGEPAPTPLPPSVLPAEPAAGPPAEPVGSADADPGADHENVARTIALRKLTASARTRHELDQSLQKKNVPVEIAAAVLDRLEDVGLIDDEAFAQSWVESRQQRRHLSRTALRRELQGKGVDRDHVEAALAAVDTNDELSAARALAAKKAAAGHGLEPAVRDRRIAGVLARRGFGSGVIATVLAELRDGPVLDPDEGPP